MERCVFRKFSTEQVDVYGLIRIKNDGRDGIDINIVRRLEVWHGELQDDNLEEMAKQTKMKYSEFVKETVTALSFTTSGMYSYRYSLTDIPNGKVEFTWKRCLMSEDIKIILGKIILSQVDNAAPTYEKIFCFSIENGQNLSDRVAALEKENGRFVEERKQALKKYEECVSSKEVLEQDLYSKFVVILNNKKDKIRELKQELEIQGRQPVASTSHLSNDTKTESENENTKTIISSSPRKRISSDTSTDEEKTPSPIQTKKTCVAKRDSLLILDNDIGDDADVAVKSTRRGRPHSKVKITSPVKVPTPTKRGTSLRKSSQKSNDNLDADNLIDEL